MIWPFRPYPPLSLTHKVQCERYFRATAAAIGAFSNEVPSVVCPQDIDPVLQQVTEEELPRTLFQFFARRIPVVDEKSPNEPLIEWAAISLLDGNDQPQPFQKHVGDDGRITKIQIDPSLKQFPYRTASIAALACAECWFRNLEEPHSTALEKVPFDVLPVFFGLTPILANAVHSAHEESNGSLPQAESGQLGSLSALEHGYLMAVAEYCLGIDYLSVVPLLRPDAGKSLKAGLKFLKKTHDTIVPQNLRSEFQQMLKPPSADDLAGRNETVLLSGLLDLALVQHCPPELIAPVARLLGHQESEIRKVAAASLRHAKGLSDEQLNDIYASLDDNSVAVRAQAILALRPGFPRDDDVVDRLVDFLNRPERTVVEASVRKLTEYSDFPDRMQSQLLKGIHTMAVKGAPDSIFPVAMELLTKVCSDPEVLLKGTFEDDPTILSMLFGTADDLPGEEEFALDEDGTD